MLKWQSQTNKQHLLVVWIFAMAVGTPEIIHYLTLGSRTPISVSILETIIVMKNRGLQKILKIIPFATQIDKPSVECHFMTLRCALKVNRLWIQGIISSHCGIMLKLILITKKVNQRILLPKLDIGSFLEKISKDSRHHLQQVWYNWVF